MFIYLRSNSVSRARTKTVEQNKNFQSVYKRGILDRLDKKQKIACHLKFKNLSDRLVDI